MFVLLAGTQTYFVRFRTIFKVDGELGGGEMEKRLRGWLGMWNLCHCYWLYSLFYFSVPIQISKYLLGSLVGLVLMPDCVYFFNGLNALVIIFVGCRCLAGRGRRGWCGGGRGNNQCDCQYCAQWKHGWERQHSTPGAASDSQTDSIGGRYKPRNDHTSLPTDDRGCVAWWRNPKVI